MLARAQEDLGSAEVLVATANPSENVVGFLLQQAIEKSLKAVLAARETEIPRTHDLEELLRLVRGTEGKLSRSLASASAAIGLAEHVLDEDDTNPSA